MVSFCCTQASKRCNLYIPTLKCWFCLVVFKITYKTFLNGNKYVRLYVWILYYIIHHILLWLNFTRIQIGIFLCSGVWSGQDVICDMFRYGNYRTKKMFLILMQRLQVAIISSFLQLLKLVGSWWGSCYSLRSVWYYVIMNNKYKTNEIARLEEG